jgi:hypothetical protein
MRYGDTLVPRDDSFAKSVLDVVMVAKIIVERFVGHDAPA